MKKLYKTYGHSKTNFKYHVIFSTKYRRKCLNDIRDNVLESFKYAENISDFSILTMEIDKDHIHFLLEFKPSLSIEQVVKRMKQISTNYLYKTCSSYLKQFYWEMKMYYGPVDILSQQLEKYQRRHLFIILRIKVKYLSWLMVFLFIFLCFVVSPSANFNCHLSFSALSCLSMNIIAFSCTILK